MEKIDYSNRQLFLLFDCLLFDVFPRGLDKRLADKFFIRLKEVLKKNEFVIISEKLPILASVWKRKKIYK